MDLLFTLLLWLRRFRQNGLPLHRQVGTIDRRGQKTWALNEIETAYRVYHSG
jgi:hypothetical protein